MNRNVQSISEWDAEIQRRRTMFLNYMLLVAVIGGLAAVVLSAVSMAAYMGALEWWIAMSPFIVSWLVVLTVWAWRGLGYHVRVLFFISLIYVLGCIIFARGGLPGSGRVWLLLLPVLAFVLLGSRAGIVSGIVASLTYIFFAIAINQKWAVPLVAEDLSTIAPLRDEGISFLLVIVIVTVILRLFSQGWVGALQRTSAANRELQTRSQELEAANEQLRLQAARLRMAAEVARVSSSTLDAETLFTEVVARIQEGFESTGVYYVGLFLLNEPDADTGERFAVLRAATGEAGKLLLEMEHKLALDDTTPIGWCIAHREARNVLRLEEVTAQFDAVPMSYTRSEIALPLRSRGRVLGALSVQSTREASFDEVDVSVLQATADQVAGAIDNAGLFRQTEIALKEAQAAHRRYLTKSWGEFLATGPVAQVDYVQPVVESVDDDLLREAQRAAVMHRRAVALDSSSTSGNDENSTPQTVLVVPLKLRGQVIGTMTLHETCRQRPWNAGEIAMSETIAEQVALSVENLRLMDEAQRRAARERLVGEISDQMQRATDMGDLLRITAEELNHVLGGSRAYVRLDAGESWEERA